MKHRLKHAVLGIASCTAAAVMVTVLTSQSDKMPVTPIVVPQAQELDSSTTRPSPVSEPPPSTTSTPVDTTVATSSSKASPAPRPPAAPPPQFASSTPVKVTSVDFQAEDARIRNCTVEWNHEGFTGRGFVDYANSVGSSVEWTVAPSAAATTNVVFRYANGSTAPRPMAIAVNGSLVASVVFPVTYGWSDWRSLTVRVNLVPGRNTIIATAITQDGGANIDKITLDAFPL